MMMIFNQFKLKNIMKTQFFLFLIFLSTNINPANSENLTQKIKLSKDAQNLQEVIEKMEVEFDSWKCTFDSDKMKESFLDDFFEKLSKYKYDHNLLINDEEKEYLIDIAIKRFYDLAEIFIDELIINTQKSKQPLRKRHVTLNI